MRVLVSGYNRRWVSIISAALQRQGCVVYASDSPSDSIQYLGDCGPFSLHIHAGNFPCLKTERKTPSVAVYKKSGKILSASALEQEFGICANGNSRAIIWNNDSDYLVREAFSIMAESYGHGYGCKVYAGAIELDLTDPSKTRVTGNSVNFDSLACWRALRLLVLNKRHGLNKKDLVTGLYPDDNDLKNPENLTDQYIYKLKKTLRANGCGTEIAKVGKSRYIISGCNVIYLIVTEPMGFSKISF